MGRDEKEAGCKPLLAVRGGAQHESSEQGDIHKSQAGKNKVGWEVQEVNGGKNGFKKEASE